MTAHPHNPIAAAKARAYQLFALGFVHPDASFVTCLEDGSYRHALVSAVGEAGIEYRWSTVDGDFADYEARYVALFQAGPKGRPLVSLNAGDYEPLRSGRARGEQLLEYLRCYRHFGVQIDADANELPDHLSCQIEFMAWLAQLEANTGDRGLGVGYRRAQYDFANRLLVPMLDAVAARFAAMQGDHRSFSTMVPAIAAVVAQATADVPPAPALMGTNESETAPVALWD